jgi:hypothetical protein
LKRTCKIAICEHISIARKLATRCSALNPVVSLQMYDSTLPLATWFDIEYRMMMGLPRRMTRNL